MLISFVVPCYNHENLLPRSVGSLLNMDIPSGFEQEIIVVDDGSPKPVVNAWGDKVKLITLPQNKGLCNALNVGIKASKGEYYAILAADDMLSKNYLNACRMGIGKADVISSDFITPHGQQVKCSPGNLEKLKVANCHGYSALVKRSMFDKIGGFDEMHPSWEDWSWWISCAEHNAVWFHIPLPLHVYYRNPKGRDAEAQGLDLMLRAKMEGFHQDLFGQGKGVVAFIIPCYKHEEYLKECIESAWNQIYPHKQIIVVDDGSPTGNIEQIIKEIGLPVTLVRQENKHLSAARNTGIKAAIQLFNPQFLVMLDADDKIENNFLEECFKEMEWGKYIYTDVKLWGDAWHILEMPDYNPLTLIRRHIHSCTFLMETRMWQTIVDKRGYGYDETMKKGYEDWEFALAALQFGFCGKRLPKPLFYYRNHKDGSMRTDAAKINDNLVRDIKNKHIWMRERSTLETMCKTCGGGSSFRVISNKSSAAQMINIPGLGLVDIREPIKVVYTGSAQNTITKIGRGLPGSGSTVYKFTGNQHTAQATGGKISNIFNIFAIDAHLFVGPFQFSRIQKEQPKPEPTPQPQTVFKPVENIIPKDSIAVIDLRPKPENIVQDVIAPTVVKKGRPKKEVVTA